MLPYITRLVDLALETPLLLRPHLVLSVSLLPDLCQPPRALWDATCCRCGQWSGVIKVFPCWFVVFGLGGDPGLAVLSWPINHVSHGQRSLSQGHECRIHQWRAFANVKVLPTKHSCGSKPGVSSSGAATSCGTAAIVPEEGFAVCCRVLTPPHF